MYRLSGSQQGDGAQQVSYSFDCGLVRSVGVGARLYKVGLAVGIPSGSWPNWFRLPRRYEPKTTCVTRYGAFEFLVMPPFSLKAYKCSRYVLHVDE